MVPPSLIAGILTEVLKTQRCSDLTINLFGEFMGVEGAAPPPHGDSCVLGRTDVFVTLCDLHLHWFDTPPSTAPEYNGLNELRREF